MTSIAHLADELAVSPGDVAVILDLQGQRPVVAGLLTSGQAEDVRAVLDPDGVRVAE